MKISKVIFMLNDLRKKHGDVEVVVQDDNNGNQKEFNAYYEPKKIHKFSQGEDAVTGDVVVVD